MGFSIDISLQPCKQTNTSSLKEIIIQKANILGSTDIYNFHETEKHNNKFKNNNIICCQFDYENIDNLAKFIIFTKKLSNTHIECVYEDDINYRVIYASSHYIKNMNKEYAKIYKSNKRKRAYSDTEYILYKALFKL